MPENEEEDLLLKQMQEQTADLEKGNLISATADGEPTEANEPPQPVSNEPPPPPPVPKAAYKETAKAFVGLFNKAQELLFSYLHKKKFTKPTDIAHCEEFVHICEEKRPLDDSEILREIKQTKPEIANALQRIKRHDEYLKNLSLTHDEQSLIAEPLAEVLEKHNITPVTPEGKLVMVLGAIMMRNALPFLPFIGEKNVNDEPKTS